MQTRYYISARGIDTLIIIFGISAIFISSPLILSGSWENLIFFFIPAILFLALLWLCLARGIYITIDQNNNLCNTFFFIKRDVVPISKIISLSTRHPMLLLGRGTEIWKTFLDDDGNPVTKGLVTRETLKGKDFNDLIEKIRQANPNIKIPTELLK